ncbi:hypothetical protein ACFQNE_02035 [Gordonia phosphorivorans]|uniref:Head-to-tail adaptor n=1 Tax=Gordonia phosphorivorans TaxID=1056982 RepID=A0ABV6H7C3_9ACTN
MTSGQPVPQAFLTVERLRQLWPGLPAAAEVGAEQLLESAGRKIREEWLEAKGSAIADDEPAAITASVSMVRAAISTAPYAGHTSYARADGPRSKSGTLLVPGGELELTDFQREQLGIPTSALAAGFFDDCSDPRY